MLNKLFAPFICSWSIFACSYLPVNSPIKIKNTIKWMIMCIIIHCMQLFNALWLVNCMQINATITQSADNLVVLADNWISCWLGDNSVICMSILLCFFYCFIFFIVLFFGFEIYNKTIIGFGFYLLRLKCIIKQLLVFVTCKIVNVSVRVVSRAEGISQKLHPIIVCYLIQRLQWQQIKRN